MDNIVEIGINESGQLYVSPEKETFPMIYREAAEVHWNEKKRFLYSPKPREWNYFNWFTHILEIADPHAQILGISNTTVWKNINDSLKEEIISWMKSRGSVVEQVAGGDATR